MRIWIDENSVTLTPFGSLADPKSDNTHVEGGKSWIELIRKLLSHSSEQNSDKTPL